MIFNKVNIYLGKNTHLSLHSLLFLFNLKNTKINFNFHMKDFDLKDKQLLISDPIESYFECISTCDIKDGNCISRCVEILKQDDS